MTEGTEHPVTRATGAALVRPSSILDRVVSDVADAWRNRRAQHATRAERAALAVGADVYVTSTRGWVTEAVIARITTDSLGRQRYVCEYPTLGDLISTDGLRSRRSERVTVAPRDVVAWPQVA
jgi:hypothetical protein